MSVREQYSRTICCCDACRVGCRTMPGMLGSGDLERIAEHRGVPCDDLFLAGDFVASDGAKVGRYTSDGRIETFRIPTITPRQNADGTCVFLAKDGKCSIHSVSPIGCAYVDTHQPRTYTDGLVADSLREITRDQKYRESWEYLLAQGYTAKPVIERRADFELEYAKVKQA
jgi:Fe-S-cluster containining protein